MNQKLAAVIGWIAACLIVLAYVLNSFSFIAATSAIYQVLNLFGGIGIVVSALATKNYPSAGLNIFWSIIAIVSLVRIWSAF